MEPGHGHPPHDGVREAFTQSVRDARDLTYDTPDTRPALTGESTTPPLPPEVWYS